MKRIIRLGLMLVLLLSVAGGAALWEIGRAGSGTIETSVASQVRLLADDFLKPRLSFDDLDYTFPSTLRLRHLRLTADDPHSPGGELDILSADEVRIELAEVPRIGEPIRLSSAVLTHPVFRAVARGDGTHKLVGFFDLIRHDRESSESHQTLATSSAQTHATTVAFAKPQVDGASSVTFSSLSLTSHPKLSAFLQMRRVEIVDGRVISDPRLPGVPAMEIDQINTTLDVQPQTDGWYKLHTRIVRAPIFDLSIDGRVSLDTFVADGSVKVAAQIGDGDARYLPPRMQQFLRDHEIRGALKATCDGTVPLLDPAHGRMEARVDLDDANVSLGDYHIPIDRLVLAGSLDDARLRLSSLHVEAIGGLADVSGSVRLDSSLTGQIHLAIDNMVIDDTIRSGTRASAARNLGGRVRADVTADGPMKDIFARLLNRPSDNGAALAAPLPPHWGHGAVEIDHARLSRIPVVSQLAHAIDQSASLVTGNGYRSNPSDRASVSFILDGDAADCQQIRYSGTVFAARGRGKITFDRRLDLLLNAGPLEKMQSLMGDAVGGTFGMLTDALASYRVSGPVGDPRINLELAGGLVNAGGHAVDAIGKGVGKASGAVRGGVGAIVEGVEKLAGAGD